MPKKSHTSDQLQKFFLLLNSGVNTRAAALASGVPTASAYRLASRASAPFGAGVQPPGVIPVPAWDSDQTPPPPKDYAFRPNYHDHTFKSFSVPVAFEGFTLQRVRNAIALHRQGFFLESYLLSRVLLSFGPVLAATGQRIAPSLALPRLIRHGTRGLSRILGEEIEAQIAPKQGLAPSPFYPDTLFGSAALDLAYMGFYVLQHVDGEPDPDTGVRPRYTRQWPVWATQWLPYRRTFIAMTTEGPVDILNDGKFTLVADSLEPHLLGAIVALGEEALDGKFTQRARASYIDRYGNPKWVGKMPEGVAVRSPEGDEFFEALRIIRGPDGFGSLPHGSEFKIEGLTGSQSTAFKDALDSNWQFVAAILLGSDGTMTRGTGVYSAPIFAGVRRDLVARDLKCEIRGANVGHIIPYLQTNYSQSIEQASGWEDPVLDIPLPDPDADARVKSLSDRLTEFHKIIEAERKGGFEVTQERVEQLSKAMEIDPPTLAVTNQAASSIQLAPTDLAKVVRVDEARASQGLAPIGDDRGAMMISELDAPAATTEDVEKVASGETPDTAAKPEPATNSASEPAKSENATAP